MIVRTPRGVPAAVQPDDPYIIGNKATRRQAESHPTRDRAEKACAILNDQEKRNGRPEVYHVIDLRVIGAQE